MKQTASARIWKDRESGVWTVQMGVWKQAASSRQECLAALYDYRENHQCLYAGCTNPGEHMTQGVGFRFCPEHAAVAREVLNPSGAWLKNRRPDVSSFSLRRVYGQAVAA